MSRSLVGILAPCLALLLSSCVTDQHHLIEISVPDQKMALYRDGVKIREYPVSTSKFGVGDSLSSNQTPLGALRVAKKIGDGAPAGTVYKSRKPTGEILSPDAPGRDPIVSRILWLKGQEASNANAYKRYIYIHGTTEERLIGTPASYGCVRMRSADVIDLFDQVGRGALVRIENQPLMTPSAPAAPNP